MSTGAELGGVAIEAADSAEAAAKLAVMYAQIELLHKEAAVDNRDFRQFVAYLHLEKWQGTCV